MTNLLKNIKTLLKLIFASPYINQEIKSRKAGGKR
jgi:hypothetical protein